MGYFVAVASGPMGLTLYYETLSISRLPRFRGSGVDAFRANQPIIFDISTLIFLSTSAPEKFKVVTIGLLAAVRSEGGQGRDLNIKNGRLADCQRLRFADRK